MKVIVYGAGSAARNLIEFSINKSIISAVVESNPSKESFMGFKVISARELKNYEYDIIIIASESFREIENMLISNGISDSRILCSFDGLSFNSKGSEALGHLDSIIKKELILNSRYGITIGSETDYLAAVRTEEGLSFVGYKNDGIMEEMVRTKKVYPYQEIDAFFELSRKKYGRRQKGFFLDCGCNIASTSVYALYKNPDLCAIGFEPVSETYLLAKANVAINNMDARITIENTGLSDKATSVYMTNSTENTGGNHVVLYQPADNNSYEKIDTISVDEYLHRKQIMFSDISYIWIDVEGFEGYVLKGLRNTLEEAEKIPIFLEFNRDHLKRAGCYELLLTELKRHYDYYTVIKRGGEYAEDKRLLISELDQEEDDDCNIFCY